MRSGVISLPSQQETLSRGMSRSTSIGRLSSAMLRNCCRPSTVSSCQINVNQTTNEHCIIYIYISVKRFERACGPEKRYIYYLKKRYYEFYSKPIVVFGIWFGPASELLMTSLFQGTGKILLNTECLQTNRQKHREID